MPPFRSLARQGMLRGMLYQYFSEWGRSFWFFLSAIVKNGHTIEGRPTGVVVWFKSQRSIVFPLSGTLYILCGYRVECSSRENASGALSTRQLPNTVYHWHRRLPILLSSAGCLGKACCETCSIRILASGVRLSGGSKA